MNNLERDRRRNMMMIIRELEMVYRDNPDKTFVQIVMDLAIGDSVVDPTEYYNFLTSVTDETIINNLRKASEKLRAARVIKNLEKK